MKDEESGYNREPMGSNPYLVVVLEHVPTPETKIRNSSKKNYSVLNLIKTEKN